METIEQPLEHACPICSVPLRKFERYPRYVCPACERKAMSADGRSVSFNNTSAFGGFAGWYSGTDESYDSNRCWIDGIECLAVEARFGGIVIQTVG